MKIYLASPFFNKAENEMKQKIKNHLISLGHFIIDPQPNGGSTADGWEKSNNEWGFGVFQKDLVKIAEADVVVAIDWGMYSDTGTAWEIGFAFGQGKKVLVIAPTLTLNKTHSLMVANGSANFISENRFLSLTEESFEMIFNGAYFAKGVNQG